MTRNVGVWIDHRRAVIVRLTDGTEAIQSIESDMERHVRYSGGKPEDQQEHRFANHLNEYYDKVIPFLHDADAILILGPGEAKGEFEKRLRTESFGTRIVGTEAMDKVPYDQISARVREYFHAPAEEIHLGKKH
jgi:hypothetical protein